mgnify:CR=1 FL=1
MDAFAASIHPVPAAWLSNSSLAPFVPDYWRCLIERRYSAATTRSYLHGVAHFARWIHRWRRLAVCDLSEADVQRFLDDHLPRCTCPSPVQRCRHQVRAGLRILLAMLDDLGVLAKPSLVPGAIDSELRRLNEHMQHARGLAENTRTQRLRNLRPFFEQIHGANQARPTLPLPTAADLRRFIDLQLDRWNPNSARVLAGTLRSYLRFRAVCGDQVSHLLPVITSPAHWRLAPLPQTLSRAEVTKLLDAFSPELPSRLRGYAMVRCLVDLGLRTREVVSLGLDDIDWQAGTLRIVKNKSRRVDVLPMPRTTGKAIANYLRSERPHTANRRVFVRHVAPLDKPIGPDVARNAVREAYLRSGLPYTRVHILRNTLASRLLDTGGSLQEVADVLRHRELDTSLIYAKVDTARLSAVALPWPGSAA